MNEIFEEEKNNTKPRKKIKKDLSKSEAFGPKIKSNRKNSEVDDPDYLDDFLQHSRGAVFITGNGNNNNKPIIKKKKIIKKIIKKKKISNNNNNNKLEEEKKIKEEKERKEREEKERKEREERERKEREEKERKEKEEKETKEKEINNKKKLIKYIKKDKNSQSPKNNSNVGKLNNTKNSGNKNNYKFNNNNNKHIENSETSKSNNSYEDSDDKYNYSSSENSYNKNSEKNKSEEENEELPESESEEKEEKKTDNINKNKIKNKKKNLKEQLEDFVIHEKFNNLIHKKIFNEIKNIFKTLFIFKKLKDFKNDCATKILKIYRGYSLRQKLKLNYLTIKILKIREENGLKILSYYKKFQNRIQIKKLLNLAKDRYIIYSSLTNNKLLYFKYKNQNGLEEHLYFEYSPILKCFIAFINKSEKTNKKIIEGYFYNENYNQLIDPIYETNKKGENIINFPQIFKKADLINEKENRLANRYIKLHRPAKRERIDDYEERKKKALDDEHLARSHTFKCKKLGDSTTLELSRSKSFMRLKSKKGKGILKPSKSYINLRSEEKKYISEMQELKNIIIKKNKFIRYM